MGNKEELASGGRIRVSGWEEECMPFETKRFVEAVKGGSGEEGQESESS